MPVKKIGAMEYTSVKYEAKDRIGIVTVDRPKALNTLNSKTIEEIRSVLAEVKNDESVRVLVITGSGDKAFVASDDKDEGIAAFFEKRKPDYKGK